MIQFDHAHKYVQIPTGVKLYRAVLAHVPSNGQRHLSRKVHRSAVDTILYGQVLAKRLNRIFGKLAPMPKPIHQRKEKKA